jgi:hypothetical protein
LLGCPDRYRKCGDKDVHFESYEFGYETRDPVEISLSVAIFNQDIFPLDITEVSQSLPECLYLRPGIGWIASS